MNHLAKSLIIISILFVITARANDSIGTTAAGGISFIKTHTITLQDEHLTISRDQVRVLYHFKNNSTRPITAQVFFPLPPYRMQGPNGIWDSEIGVTKDAPFTNFSVKVNDHSVPFQVMTRALMNGKDITALLQQNHIPLNTELAAGHIPMSDQQQAEFKKWYEKAKNLNLLNAKGDPRWKKQVAYYWTQTFPPQQTIKVEHWYRPATGEFYIADLPKMSSTQILKQFQARTRQLFDIQVDSLYRGKLFVKWLKQQMRKKTPENSIYAFIYNVNYILTTGANWAGPIRHFKLTLIYPNAGAIAFSSFFKQQPAKLLSKQGRFQLELNNFKPHQNLHILLGIAQPH